MANKNLTLWESVQKTDPDHTKPITGKQYSGNSPKPHWIVLKATERFGPCGIGWGFTIEERIEDGPTHEAGCDRLHVAKVKVWYKWEGEVGHVEHMGSTPFSGLRKDGKTRYLDEDAPKKSVTDALIKAMSMIGFAGDIFLGRFDDSKYIETTRREFDDKEAGEETERIKAMRKAEDEQRKKDYETGVAILKVAVPRGVESLALAWSALSEKQRVACKDEKEKLKTEAMKATRGEKVNA